jgi:predicted MFS family arabinose efflux permease
VLGALVLGVALLAAFVLWERRTKAPMLPMRFFRSRAFATANPANFLVFASLYGTLFFLAQYFQTVLGEGPLGAGLRLMPWTATLMICAPIAGRWADRFGERWFVVGGLSLQTVGATWIAVVADTDTGYPDLLPALIIGGAGLTMAMPAAQKAVVGSVRPNEIGQASGAFMMLRILGGVFGVAVSVAVFAGSGATGRPPSSVTASRRRWARWPCSRSPACSSHSVCRADGRTPWPRHRGRRAPCPGPRAPLGPVPGRDGAPLPYLRPKCPLADVQAARSPWTKLGLRAP